MFTLPPVYSGMKALCSLSVKQVWTILLTFSVVAILMGSTILYGKTVTLYTPRANLPIIHNDSDTVDHFASLSHETSRGHYTISFEHLVKPLEKDQSQPMVEDLHPRLLHANTSSTDVDFKMSSQTFPEHAEENQTAHNAVTQTQVMKPKTSNEVVRTVHTSNYTKEPPKLLPVERYNQCDLPEVKAWKEGVITQLHPQISANCKLLQKGSKAEAQQVQRALRRWKNVESEDQWLLRMDNCSEVLGEFLNNHYVSEVELDFPLAYIFVVYANARQVVRLLKAVYRSHNLYCIHPDARSGEKYAHVFRTISRCLDNVFVASKLEKVYYQHHTIMDAQLNCMDDLTKYSETSWTYVINLCGKELPLKTNREIVNSLRTLKGANAVDTEVLNPKQRHVMARFMWKASLNNVTKKLHLTTERLGPPPHSIKIFKSMNFIAVTRPFVEFLLNSKMAKDLRDYLEDVKIPEEHFYASLAKLPGVPGGVPRGKVPIIDQYIWLNAAGHTRNHKERCYGRMVHYICILTVQDLPEIYHMGVDNPIPTFFFNKYFMEEDHVVMDCMEERLIHRNMLEYQQDCKRTPSSLEWYP